MCNYREIRIREYVFLFALSPEQKAVQKNLGIAPVNIAEATEVEAFAEAKKYGKGSLWVKIAEV